MGDPDNDGWTDIVSGDSGDDMYVWKNTRIHMNVPFDSTGNDVGPGNDNTRIVSLGDVDGDGDMDVLGAAYHADDITWWKNIGGSAGYTVTSNDSPNI